MNRYISWLRTSLQLGWSNASAVAFHRITLLTGWYRRTMPIAPCPVPETLQSPVHPAPYIETAWASRAKQQTLQAAEELLDGRAIWFSSEHHSISLPPDWYFDPGLVQHFQDATRHWSQCHPFAGSDIKRGWELSRWGWAPLLARAWRLSKDDRYRQALNAWIQSWCRANPVNGGINWLCGQEASIRLLHALQAWQLCDAPAPGPVPRRNVWRLLPPTYSASPPPWLRASARQQPLDLRSSSTVHWWQLASGNRARTR